MHGLMMDTPLLISLIADHAVQFHPDREVVSITSDNPRHRCTFKEVIGRAKQLANALESLGLKKGDRVATMAWNDYRHLEIYYGVSGAGMVCHTINPRLFTDQLEYIIDHAEDRYIFVDAVFVPLLEELADKIGGVEGFVVLTDDENMPDTTLKNICSYESLIGQYSSDYEWPVFDERSASALCYTSGTTGHPKGVLYSHRSTVLHSLAVMGPDAQGFSALCCVLTAVPLFHVNAWGVPYTALMCGAKLVLPGPQMGDAEALFELMESESVTDSLGVPTVWLGFLQYLTEAGKTPSTLRRVLVGGSAAPRSLMENLADKHNVMVVHGWGMTETSPLGCMNKRKGGMEQMAKEDRLNLATKAGRALFGVQMRIVDDNGDKLPWDGATFGALQVRGPWVCSDYFKLDGSAGAHSKDGWLDTGDVATIDANGFMAITDRTKDVIKSGGEWISSIDLENIAVSHPGVAEAAAIGVAHPKWGERPLIVCVKSGLEAVDREGLLALFDGRVAKWCIPDDIVFVEELPHTATGKIRKVTLREQLKDYAFPS